MRVLITGSHGFLGTALKHELRRRKHSVFGCDLTHSDDPQEVRADIADYRQLELAFGISTPDIVYHFAGEFGRLNGRAYYEQLWRTNCIGTQNVIRFCEKYSSRLVFASSSEAYGDLADHHNLRESLLAERVPQFHNEYALTKWVGEKQIEIAVQHAGLQAIVLRFFNAYGPGEYYTPYRSVVCLFIYHLLAGLPITVYRNYTRTFQHITDWVHGVANVADRFDRMPNGSSYNIAGAEITTVERLKDLILERIGGSASEIIYQDKESTNVTDKHPDITRACAYLGHDPKIMLADGLVNTITWYRQVYGFK